ncbi:MAG: amidohydrolase family protein, partial [Firmicutes bacterium]|nr:amidohydrolase family protein [Bacillota bacterium]
DAEKLKDKQPEFRAKLELYKDALRAGREAIKRSGITLGYGTDLVANHNNYDSGWEFAAWTRSGMGGFRALKAATSVNAKILQIDDKVGTLEKGKLADISAWRRDLLSDPAALLDCAFVMKEGVEYETEVSEDIDQV